MAAVFDDDAVRRIQAAVRWVERQIAKIPTPIEILNVAPVHAAWFETPSAGILPRVGSVLGSGTCDRRRLIEDTGILEDYTIGGVVETETVWNPYDWLIPGTQDVQAALIDGQWVLAHPVYYKRFIRFSLTATLATTDASKSATIVTQYGPGVSNPNTGSGQIVVYNMPATTNYVFSGASAKTGYAFHHDANNYYIFQMECP